ncbi:MAG TPA: phosphonoacetaldehyde reductase [Clostridia bacterium]|nr:phosphonoacetaldehyde reductase [Clostridia bacterium]
MNYKPFCNTEIEFTNCDGMKQQLLSLKAKNVVFIASRSSIHNWGLGEFISEMMSKFNLIWLDEGYRNPTQNDIFRALTKIDKSFKKADCIIAIGGGSKIDLAKAISAFHDENTVPTENEIKTSIKNKSYLNKISFIDIISVPSTAGTGSEVTQWATIWDSDKEAKYSIDCANLKPRKAVIVSELTLTASPELTLATGLDALCHAVEAYWSKHTTPLVQDISLRSIQTVVKYLGLLMGDNNNPLYREKMCRASVLAGLAFSQTRTTACHSISYPLTMLYNIPHGFAVALTLAQVAQKNKGSFANDYELFEVFECYGGIEGFLSTVSKDIVDLRLGTWGVTDKDIKVIVMNSFTGGRMDNNPYDLSECDITQILENIL